MYAQMGGILSQSSTFGLVRGAKLANLKNLPHEGIFAFTLFSRRRFFDQVFRHY
jgi:hypothetical protein